MFEIFTKPIQLYCLFIWLISSLSVAQQIEQIGPQPDPKYTPAQVVSIQMNALSKNDQPYQDAGIEVTYRFASPSNKASTGPLERFQMLFDIPSYAPMINHLNLEIGPTEEFQQSANVPIIITDMQGQKIPYLFRLNKQSKPPYENCWMTSTVIRIPTVPAI